MMLNKFNVAIPAKSLGYILVCGGIILIVVLALVSFHRYNTNRAQTVKKIQNQIDEQKALKPIYDSLIKVSETRNDVFKLPNPKRTRLTRQELDKFQDAVRLIAGKSGLMNVLMLPDVKTVAGSTPNLLYNVAMKGELANFRRFFIELGALPYVDQIEEITIKQYADSMEFKLKIWVVLAN